MEVMIANEMDQLVARITKLEAIDAVLKAKHRYGELVDRLADRIDQDDLQDLGQLFTEDADIDFVAVRLPGRQGILDLYGGQMQQNFSWLWHSFPSPVIDVDGDNAMGRWTLQGLTIAQGATSPTKVYGRYIDSFVKIGDQ